MKVFRNPSLILAAVLQILPLSRVAVIWQQPVSPLWAILLRWSGGAAAALGSIEAVSGASTVITNPLTAKGTNGVPFATFRLTTAPDQAHYWTATGLPPGITLQGKSGQTYWILGGTPTSAGTFNVKLTAKDQITSGADRTVSGTLVMTIVAVGTAPAITTQPISQSALAGTAVTLFVGASGTAPLTYQWKKDTRDLTGQTANTLTLPSVSASDAGSYTVLVKNGIGSILSQPATLTVTLPAVAPSITAEPSSLKVHAGDNAGFTVSASGTAPLSYQWRFGSVELPGATGPSLTLTSVDESKAGDYTVEIKNSAGSVVSSAATLDVSVLKMLACVENGPSTDISWNGIAGRNYSILTAPNLGEPWQQVPVEAKLDSSGAMTATITNQFAGKFFRVIAQP